MSIIFKKKKSQKPNHQQTYGICTFCPLNKCRFSKEGEGKGREGEPHPPAANAMHVPAASVFGLGPWTPYLGFKSRKKKRWNSIPRCQFLVILDFCMQRIF